MGVVSWGMTSSLNIPHAESWIPAHEAFGKLLPHLQTEAGQRSPYSLSALDDVGIIEIEQATGVAYFGAAPHTDKAYDQWFVMFVVEARGTQQLNTANTKKIKDRMASAQTIDLEDGQILVFDAHKVHWVDLPEGLNADAQCAGRDFASYLGREYRDQMSVLVGTEMTQRPRREEAEQLLLDYLRVHTPKCWAKAELPAPAPAPRRRGLFG